jgi:hypothetical protein
VSAPAAGSVRSASVDMGRSRPRRTPPAWLWALGRADLPTRVEIAGHSYAWVRTFKHDFFAATGLYDGPLGPAVVKFGRRASVLGLPAAWIGRHMVEHETRMLARLAGLHGVPPLLGRLGAHAFAHGFVAGHDLQRNERVNDEFFPRLAALISGMHARGVAYVDLEKRENIIVGDDGRPHLVDFQIAFYWPDRSGGRTALARWFLSILHAADRYHLLKHWRRLRPDQLSAEILAEAGPPPWIVVHRAVFRPLIQVRRRLLEWLGARRRGQTGRSEEARDPVPMEPTP